jgi:opacity protein-like surface antigen
MKSARAVAALLLAVAAAPRQAAAFRPFDGTDAAVADKDEMEIELGPVGYERDGAERVLIAPAARFNYGFAEGWEATLEGQAEHGLSGGMRRSTLVGNTAALKGVLREGSLQDKPGPSVATEAALLLPGIGDEGGTGSSLTGIVSQQWPLVSVHFNLAATVTREQHGDYFVSTIVEGPRDWPVRPVAEVFHERDFGTFKTTSGLIGAIWQVRRNLAFDAAFRHASINDHTQDEVRAGLTFSFPLR